MFHSFTANYPISKVIAIPLMVLSLATGELSRGENAPATKTKAELSATPARLDLNSNEKAKTASPTSDQSKEKEEEKNAQTAMRKALPQDMAEIFPIGRVFKGVAIPSYGDEDLESVMNSDIVKRISEDFVNFTNLVIIFYNSVGKPETSIQMDKAQYNLVTGILTSKSPANIEQEKFTMRGDQMTFEVDSHFTQLIGNVRMLIFQDELKSGGKTADSEGTVVITSQKSTMDNVNRQITFLGEVLVQNKKDQVTMTSDKLEVFMLPEGTSVKDASGKISKISHAVASGGIVEINKIDEKGKAQIALARQANYNAITQNAVLSGGPPSLQDGEGNFVSTKSRDSKIILRNDGRYEIMGSEPHTITFVGGGKGNNFSFGEGIK